MIQYNNFFRAFGLRQTGQLKAPPLPKLERFELPVLSMVHFVPQSATNLWPSEDWLMYQHNKKPIRLVNHLDLVNPVGSPRLRTGDFINKQRLFRKDHPRFRVALEIEEMKREERAIVTHNYGLLFERWKYQRSMFTNINRWNNVFSTMFSTAGEAVSSGYRQYFELTMPRVLPSITVLQRAEAGWNKRNIPIFNSYQMLMLHHIWVWLGENRHKGMIEKYFPKGLKGVHLILREGGRFCVLDMSLLDTWRKPSAHEEKMWQEQVEKTPGIPALHRGKFTPQTMQKVLVRLMMSVMQVRVEDVPENLGDEESTVDKANEKVLDAVISGASDSDKDKVPENKSSTVDGEQTEEEAFAGYTEEDYDREMADLDKDLQMLESIGDLEADENAVAEFADGDEGEVLVDEAEPGQDPEAVAPVTAPDDAKSEAKFFPEDPNEAFKAVCDKAAKEGIITAAEYLRLMEQNAQAANLPAPLGKEGTLSQFVKIEAKDVKIDPDDPEIKIPDIATVTDKSMLKSSLQVMNKRYANNIFQKDVAGMVTQMSAAGIAIRSYNVEEKEDITGSHFEYTLQIKPIEGTASTIRFKLPKIEDDGNFKINGVPYRLRMQRGDERFFTYCIS